MEASLFRACYYKHREMNHLSIFSLNNVAGNIHENIHSYMVYGLCLHIFVFVLYAKLLCNSTLNLFSIFTFA